MAFYIRGSQETERLVPPVPVVILDSGWNNSRCFSPALGYKSEQHRGHAHLVDLCASPLFSYKWRRRHTKFFLGRGFESHHLPKINYYDFPHVEIESTPPVYSGHESAWILTRSPVDPADLLSRRFQEGNAVRLSLGMQLVNLLQVVKRINTPLIP